MPRSRNRPTIAENRKNLSLGETVWYDDAYGKPVQCTVDAIEPREAEERAKREAAERERDAMRPVVEAAKEQSAAWKKFRAYEEENIESGHSTAPFCRWENSCHRLEREVDALPNPPAAKELDVFVRISDGVNICDEPLSGDKAERMRVAARGLNAAIAFSGGIAPKPTPDPDRRVPRWEEEKLKADPDCPRCQGMGWFYSECGERATCLGCHPPKPADSVPAAVTSAPSESGPRARRIMLRKLHDERHELQRAGRLGKPYDAIRLGEVLRRIDEIEMYEAGPGLDRLEAIAAQKESVAKQIDGLIEEMNGAAAVEAEAICSRCLGAKQIGNGIWTGGFDPNGGIGSGAVQGTMPCPECSGAKWEPVDSFGGAGLAYHEDQLRDLRSKLTAAESARDAAVKRAEEADRLRLRLTREYYDSEATSPLEDKELLQHIGVFVASEVATALDGIESLRARLSELESREAPEMAWERATERQRYRDALSLGRLPEMFQLLPYEPPKPAEGE